MRRGQQVTVTLPDGVTTTPGTVAAVSSVATASDGSQGPGGQPGQGGAGSQESVAMTVRLNRPLAAGNFDQAPVSVSIVAAHVRDVLAVPVSALVALAGGGYAVEVVHGTGTAAARQLVAVQTGLFSSTLVQVVGRGHRRWPAGGGARPSDRAARPSPTSARRTRARRRYGRSPT